MNIKRSFIFCCLIGWLSHGFADEGRRLEILFLGDQGHHQPAERAHWFSEAVGASGFNITYTEDADALTPELLAKYDALLVYANIDRVTPQLEQTILDYVASGKGYVPVHCASYCFQNSPPLIRLTGGQFLRHGSGVFTTEIVRPDHPAMNGVDPFTAWDETYVHTKHHEDGRTVLMERVEGEHREPWTWVRTHGAGRVFYTASGHDARAWKTPGFQQMLMSGIRWAVGNEAAAALAALDIQPLRYEERPTVQNYEKRDPKLQYQFPLSPIEAQKHIQVPAGFEAQLFASEPDIVCPMAMTWDERGRLWVLESVDYPNRVNDDRKGRDRIKICEDTDQDGRADKFTIFAEGLNVPTGITRKGNGVIVIQAPDMLFLEDVDGDDRADKTTVIHTGWGRGDTHAVASSLQYGLDNYYWGCVGYSNYGGTVGGREHRFGRGLFRFKEDGSYLEFVGQFSNNAWGLGFNERGDIFGSTANNTHHMYVGVPIRYYEDLPGVDRVRSRFGSGAEKLDGHYAMHPTTTQIRQVDVFGGFTAAAGHHFYTARTYPQKYWNRMALVCEPTGGLVHQGVIEAHGGGYHEPHDAWNLMASSDAWFSPIHAEVGPDGQVWVADWYNFIIQHNPTPSLDRGGFPGRNGKGNAHENPLRDEQHGRIYRVVYPREQERAQPVLSSEQPQGLVAALQHPNMFWRKHAQRMLVERGKPDVVPALIKLVEDSAVDALGLNVGAIHALWTLKGLQAFDGASAPADRAAIAALKHESAAVRKNAVQVLPANADSAKALTRSGVLVDVDLNTRATALLALADQPTDLDAGALLHDMEPSGDKWVELARSIAVAQHARGFLTAALKNAPAPKTVAPNEAPNLLPNPSFETVTDSLPDGWQRRHYQGTADQEVVRGGRRDAHAVKIHSASGADTSVYTDVTVEPSTRYRLSAWIKTEGVSGAQGALLNVHEHQRSQGLMRAVSGTSDWVQRTLEFNTGANESRISINLLFGGWGAARGTAWYDDVALIRLGPAGIVDDSHELLISTAAANLSESDLTAVRGSTPPEQWNAFAARWGFGPVEETSATNETAVDVILQLGVIKDIIKFDKAALRVPAGKTIKLVFSNPDHMLHNWLLLKPDSVERVGALADKMLTDPKAMAAHYIPASTDILAHSKLLMPGEQEEIVFVAPDEPGRYPYICTFPGHWRIMQGVLIVE